MPLTSPCKTTRNAALALTKADVPAGPGTLPDKKVVKTPPVSPPSRRLHRKHAAVYLGVSLSWLDKSRLKGDGPAFLRIGARVVYDTADLDSYMADSRRRSTSG